MKPRPQTSPAPPGPDRELSERIFRTLFRNTGQIRQIMTPFFEKFEISVAQWVVLRILLDREEEAAPPIRLVDLSHHLAIRQPSLTAVINKLTLQGFIERLATEGDRRTRRVQLTPRGRELVERVLVEHRQKVKHLMGAWDAAEKQQFLGLLEKLHTHLETVSRSASADLAPADDCVQPDE